MSTIDKTKIEKDILTVIRTIYDPEIPVNIYDLGLIYEINVSDEADVHVLMTLTTPNC
ncbi:MAG: iron-sulfur cluster assembly protein, partial [Bacteroidales bacterium]|nr:iron-sulfur cluster assembly protein [Bacteroidales bacterium]MDY0078619.1 iron-sulfur cluster assembly protein [Bacteroidales bacterium]